MMDQSNLSFAINDRILLGEGLFETIKVQHGKPCFPELHWQRLNKAAQSLNIRFALTKKEWVNLLSTTIQKDKIVQGGLKAILSGGVAARGLIAQGDEGRLLIQSFTYTLQHKALNLTQASWLRDASNPIYQLKTVNYLEAILARRAAMQKGADDALFFNTQHHVTESTCANIFLVCNDCFITPPLKDGVLPGITRARILNHCIRLRIKHEERSITEDCLQQAEAVFLSNSLQGIHYVGSIEDCLFAPSHPMVENMIALLAEEKL